jgi:NADH-quinone oxidoreductase subunit J
MQDHSAYIVFPASCILHPVLRTRCRLTIEIIIFGSLAFIAVAAALLMILTRNAVHSALFLVIVMSALAVFFLGLNGPFIAMVQVAVYAGAIMVLFLFVIMLLGAERVGARDRVTWHIPMAIILAVAVLALGGFMLLNQAPVQIVDLPTDQIVQGSAEAIGAQLYSTYLFPFEAVSVILLVAIVGAVVLSRDERKKTA